MGGEWGDKKEIGDMSMVKGRFGLNGGKEKEERWEKEEVGGGTEVEMGR